MRKDKLEKKNKNNRDGGLESQWNVKNLSSLPSGTVLDPVDPQNQENEASKDKVGEDGQGILGSSNKETN